MKKILVFTALSFFSCSVYAQTSAYRDATVYNLWDRFQPVMHITYTYPIKRYQPVFAWRTHTNFDGTLGAHSYDGDLIGYTNHLGVLSIVAPRLSVLGGSSNLCGWFRNERVAVGSKDSPQSNSLNFTIEKTTAGIVLPGPLPPYDPVCGNPSGGSFPVYIENKRIEE